MKRWLAAVVAVAAVGGLFVAWRSGLFAARSPGAGGEERRGDTAAEAAAPVAVDLFFPGAGGLLHPERREIAGGGSPEELAARVLGELFAGPRSERLRPPLPSDVAVRRVYLVGEGMAIVDLARSAETPYAVGAQEELLALYSLVDTLALNVPEASRVLVLWNGEQPTTFAGHVDTTRALAPDLGLVAGRGRGEVPAGSEPGDDHG